MPARRAFLNQRLTQHTSHLAGRVAAYLPLPEEAHAWDFARTAYLPVIQPDQSLRFCQYRAGDPLVPGQYSIPIPAEGELLSIDQMDWVLVPLTAIDGVGCRAGMGGGFYDRSLSAVVKARRVGVAYDGQRVPRIAAQPWDVALGRLVTPAGWTRF